MSFRKEFETLLEKKDYVANEMKKLHNENRFTEDDYEKIMYNPYNISKAIGELRIANIASDDNCKLAINQSRLARSLEITLHTLNQAKLLSQSVYKYLATHIHTNIKIMGHFINGIQLLIDKNFLADIDRERPTKNGENFYYLGLLFHKLEPILTLDKVILLIEISDYANRLLQELSAFEHINEEAFETAKRNTFFGRVTTFSVDDFMESPFPKTEPLPTPSVIGDEKTSLLKSSARLEKSSSSQPKTEKLPTPAKVCGWKTALSNGLCLFGLEARELEIKPIPQDTKKSKVYSPHSH